MSLRQLCAAGFIAAYQMYRDALKAAYDMPAHYSMQRLIDAVRSTWAAVQDARRAYLEACA